MNRQLQRFLFKEPDAPLAVTSATILGGAGLILMASCRLAFALVTLGALLWVYGLTVTILFFARPILPTQGMPVIRLFLMSLLGSLFLLLFLCVCPLLGMSMAYLLVLVPAYAVGSPVCMLPREAGGRKSGDAAYGDLKNLLLKAFIEAGVLGGLIVAAALIREPLSFMTLSLPGGSKGMVELFNAAQTVQPGSVLPIRILSGAAGALILMGYGAAIVQNVKKALAEGAL